MASFARLGVKAKELEIDINTWRLFNHIWENNSRFRKVIIFFFFGVFCQFLGPDKWTRAFKTYKIQLLLKVDLRFNLFISLLVLEANKMDKTDLVDLLFIFFVPMVYVDVLLSEVVIILSIGLLTWLKCIKLKKKKLISMLNMFLVRVYFRGAWFSWINRTLAKGLHTNRPKKEKKRKKKSPNSLWLLEMFSSYAFLVHLLMPLVDTLD